ncbi:hypothetical protein ES703_119478 [subsurface metagenome]
MMSANKNIIIREGLPKDAQDFTNLILLSGPNLFPATFGSGVRSLIQNLFRQRKNLFSFEHSYFIEVDDTKAGMIIGYDWKTERREKWRTGLLLVKYMKQKFFTQILSLLKAQSITGRVEDNEYYVSNVAVYPEFRGNNLGTNLLLKIESEAKRYGVERSTLDVEVDNEDAIRLYNRLGYSIVGKPRKVRINSKNFAFFKCVKTTTIK